MRTFSITGWVIDRQAAHGLPGLLVEAWDREGRCPDLVDCAITGDEGRFELSVSEQHIQDLFGEHLPELTLRVFSGQTLLAGLESGPVWRLGARPSALRIRVDPNAPAPGPESPAPFVVRGRIADAQTGPAAQVSVRAYDRRISAGGSREVLLGQATTDGRGAYHIPYSLGSGAPKLKADLLVRAVDQGDVVLAESPVLCRAPTTARVDLVIGGEAWKGPSAYERLTQRITPLLIEAELELADLEAEGVTRLACSAGLDGPELGWLHAAARLARTTGRRAELFFALASQGLPLDLPALLPYGPDALRDTLGRAIEANIVSATLSGLLHEETTLLLPLIVDAALTAPPDPARPSIGAVLAAGLAPLEARRTLLTLYHSRTAEGADFWQQVYSHFANADTPDDLKLSLQLGLLTQGHTALLEQLRTLREQDRIKRLESLIDIDDAEWRALLDAAGGEPAIPPHITGATPDERVERFLRGILEPLRATFPNQFLRRALDQAAESGGAVTTGVVQILTNLPDLDLRAGNIDLALSEAGEAAFQGVPEAERALAVRQLKAIQRLSRITMRAEGVVALLDAGHASALSIARMPRARFAQQFADVLGGEAAARLAHAQARHHAACAQTLWAAAKQATADPAPWAVAGDAEASNGSSAPATPDLQSLFGSQSLCDCEQCQSIYSPAAYFVDLLQFLDVDPGGGAARPLAVLLGRRPDLEQLRLTCANTNTPLPYIDLVNEALEAYVMARFVQGENPVTTLPAYDTGEATAEELRAAPQTIVDETYTRLATEVVPPALPFHRPLLVTRTYLEHLGTTRLEVMETFRRAGAPLERALVAEALGLSGFEYEILAGLPLTPPRLLREFYGYDVDTVAKPDGSGNESWQENIARVPELLRRTGISYDELIELVKTWFVNRDQSNPSLRMALESETTDCDLARTRLTNLTDPALSRMHRLLRLRRCLDLSLADLDRALFALGATEIDEAALRKLADVKRLSTELRRPIPELLPLWAPIDTWGEGALYLRLFQDRAAIAQEDRDAFALHYPFDDPEIKDGASLPYIQPPGVQLGQRDAVVLAALRLTGPDLARLCARLGLGSGAQLDIAALSALYRHAFLARALGLRVSELLALLDLTTIEDDTDAFNPFRPHDPAGAIAFVAQVRRIQRSGFSVAELDYLLRHRVEPGKSPAPSPSRIDRALETIHVELVKIAAETTAADDPTGIELERRLSLVLDRDVVEQAMAVLLGSEEPRPSAPAAFIKEHFAPFADAAQIDADLVLTPELTEEQRLSNLARVHEWLAPWLRELLSRRAVVEVLATAVGLDVPLVTTLLGSVLHAQIETETGKPAIADFLTLADEPPTANHAKAYERLHKAALIIQGFKLDEREVVYLSAHASAFGGFDFNALPLDPQGGVAGARLAGWARLADLVRLRGSAGRGRTWLLDLFERAVPDNGDPVQHLTAFLAEQTGWDAAQLATLTGISGLDFDEADFRTEQRLLPLAACVTLAARLGASAETLFSWAATEPTAAQAREVVQAVRSRAGSSREQWLEIARTLNDRLREAQRSALVAFLVPRLADEGVTSAEQLFEHFLIDTQMSACMATSRIKQAISSVQLFVQRCLLGLERPEVQPDSIDADQWKWRKSYRVWEANRKVFLYPENWIEPELRDDKSPFFKELETELLQKDLSNAAVEQALTHYLEKLDDVARLDICGMYWQKEVAQAAGADDIDVLHVIGRTWNEPRVYYYRRLVNRREWTPWERVPLDIQGN